MRSADMLQQSLRAAGRSGQRGLALPIILIFLVIILIVAAVGVRRATLTEGITRNQLDYEIARQSAEAALRDAQRDVMLPKLSAKPTNAVCLRADRRLPDTVTPATFGPTCPLGQCRLDASVYSASDWSTKVSPAPWWPTTGTAATSGNWGDNTNVTACAFSGGVPIGTFTGTPKMLGVARQPEYLIEYFERFSATQRFVRLTARGFGADKNTEVVLQSYLRFPDAGT